MKDDVNESLANISVTALLQKGIVEALLSSIPDRRMCGWLIRQIMAEKLIT